MNLRGWWALAIGASLAAGCAHTLSSPDRTLAVYFQGLRSGKIELVDRAYKLDGQAFYLPGPKPIDSYRLTKRTVYGLAEVRRWNDLGIIPPAAEGDVQLDVEVVSESAREMFSFNLRRYGQHWLIYAHSTWGVEPQGD